MSMRLADRLVAARRRRFVGRDDERALFRSALIEPELPFCVLHIYGPGGVGKTTLLKEFAGISDELHISSTYIDVRNLEPTSEAFMTALQLSLGVAPPESPLERLASMPRHVLLIDTAELLGPLESWLRETFLPQLRDSTLIVFADRRPPAPIWHADPGWQDLIRVMPLRNLNRKESADYLARRHVPFEQHAQVLDFTHGHPLALSLVADVFAQRVDVQFQPESTPDIVKALLEQLVQKVPGPAHRSALELCALIRVTTESLLAEALSMPDAHELFDWLRGLSFIESGPFGLFPHDLAREALVADLRWRNRSWYVELHRRARDYYAKLLEQTQGLEQQRALFDYVFLHRDNPVVRPFLEWQESGSVMPEGLRDDDIDALSAIVERHEGEESAGLLRYWLRRQPEGALIFRAAEQQPVGFLLSIALEKCGDEEMDTDPAVSTALRHLRAYAPVRPGEIATLFRFWMGADSYQDVSPMQSLLFINAVRHYFTPSLVFTFFPCANPDFWAPLFDYAEIPRIPETDFEVGGRKYGVFGHNWRAVPPFAWLAVLAEKEIAAPQSPRPPQATAPVMLLSQPDFAAAVHEALRNFSRADALQRSPLLQSRLVIERAGAAAGHLERIAALQGLLRQACDSLRQSSRDTRFYRAVYHTYIHAAPTQEQAAELLDLPFSTFRRHLKEGIARLAEILWQWELEKPPA